MSRIIKAKQNYREKLLNLHYKYKEKFEKAKETYRMYQCNVRSHSVKKYADLEEELGYLNGLRKHDPNKQNQREKLFQQITEVNKKLGLGLKL